jgi:hypothetical protein
VVLAAAVGVVLMFQLDRVAVDGPHLQVIGDLPAPFEPLPEVTRSAADGALRLGAVGIAAGSGLTAWLEFELLRRRLAGLAGMAGRVRMGGGQLGRTLLAGVAAAVVAAGMRRLVLDLDLHPIPTAVLGLAPAGAVYLGLALALRVPEGSALVRPLRRLRRGG